MKNHARPRPHTDRAAPQAQTSRRQEPARVPVEIILGLHAGLAVFERRREDIQRVTYSRAVSRDVEGLARWALARRLRATKSPSRS